MSNEQRKYQKPTLQYWAAEELNAIEATMSGGGGSGGGVSRPSSDYVFTTFPKGTTSWSSLGEEVKSVAQIITEQGQIKAISSNNIIQYSAFALSGFTVTAVVGWIIDGVLMVAGSISDYVVNSISDLERDAQFHLAKEWRWKHTSSIPYVMEFRYSTWFSHNGQRIGDKKTVTKTISFEYGDYTVN